MFCNYRQLVLPLNLEILLPQDDPVLLLNDICEELDFSQLYKSYGRVWRKYDPVMMFKLVVYGYIRKYYSCRDLENACRRDICFMWLLNGCSVPDSATFARFQNERLTPVMEKLFFQLVEKLYALGEISFSNIFVDGTKIEANASKYSFVWKRAVEKLSSKLSVKAQSKITDIQNKYSLNSNLSLNQCISYLIDQARLCNIELVSGKGKHKTQLQKDIEILLEYAEKYNKYSKYLSQIGSERKSMSKTDPDATFMRMKEDYMHNGQLRAAYNIQIGVESEYIVGIGSFTDRSDVQTLIPFLNKIKQNTGKRHINVVADAGYESEENYRYLEEHNQASYIKPTNYELSKTRKYATDIFRAEHMKYDAERDTYICSQGNELKYIFSKQSTTKNGYKVETKIYGADSCEHCPLKEKCFKNKRNCKQIQVSEPFTRLRKRSMENICSEEGIRLRVNRSIQVEGAFGVIKQDMGFRRFLTRGKRKTETQFMLIAFAYNICKLQSRKENGRFKQELFEIKNTG